MPDGFESMVAYTTAKIIDFDHLDLPTIETVLSLRSGKSLQPPVFYRRRNATWIKDALYVDNNALLLIAKRLQ
ncbi:MAG: hypothetical protein CV081_12680 [Nitrospira sp. LK265]|nr:hypothetical protein [Nitrospira sp. LK265]